MRQYNIRSSEFVYLLILLEIPNELTQSDFSQLTNIDKSAVARSCGALVAKGYLRRYQKGENRKNKYVELTIKGRNVSTVLFNTILTWNARIENGISEEDLETTARTLQAMAQNI